MKKILVSLLILSMSFFIISGVTSCQKNVGDDSNEVVKTDIQGISFTGKTVDYDGNSHSLAITGTLPEGVSVSYTGNGKTEPGVYEVTASFTDTTGKYNKLPDMKATLTINKINIKGITFEDQTIGYDGLPHSLEISGTLPEGVSVTYTGNEKVEVGEYEVIASFTDSTNRYVLPADMKATLKIEKDGSYWDVTYLSKGQLVSKVVVKNNEVISELPNVPEVIGYTGAWDYDSSAIVADTTINAVYTANNYNLIFDTNGGAELANQTVTYDSNFTLPTPTREGEYTFVKWIDEDGNEYKEGVYQTAGDTTLKAVWQFDISYQNQFGHEYYKKTVTSLDVFDMPNDINTHICGWYLEKEYINQFNFDQALNEITTLYAKFDYNYEYTIDEDGNATIVKIIDPTVDTLDIVQTVDIYPVIAINNGIASQMTNLVEITIPFVGEKLDGTGKTHFGSIFGAEAAANNVNTVPATLRKVTVTGGETVISNAFFGCSNLTTVILPDTVKSMGASVFNGCSNIENLTIPFVGAAQKSADDTYQYPLGYIFGTTSYSGGVDTRQYYYGYYATSTTYDNYYIPSSLKNVNVLNGIINYGAFYACSNIKNVNLENITAISSYAFYGCSGLESVTIPEITAINEYTFYNCSFLKEISIPTTVESIGTYAFAFCAGLTEVVVPNSVTSIGFSAFNNCTGITSITLPFVGDSIKTSEDTYQRPFGYIFGTTGNALTTSTRQYYYGAYTTSTTNDNYYIPNTLKTVTITGGNILYGAFYNCSGLETINIPSNITSIGGAAFYNCTIKEVVISNTVTSIGISAFYGCVSMTTLEIPEALETIGASAFYNCAGMLKFDLPQTLKTIGENAFFGCAGITEIVVPNSVTNIGMGAFGNCTSLASITVPFVGGSLKTSEDTYQRPFGYIFGTTGNALTTQTRQYYYGAYTTSTTNDNYYIPNTLKTVTITGGNILYGAFYNCSGLETIILPNEATSIGGAAFYNCGFQAITIPQTVTSIANHAFYNCASLASLELPVVLETISQYSFSGCTLLADLSFGSSLKTIGQYAFQNCSTFKNVVVPSNVESIGYYAFSGCSNIESMVLPFVGTSVKNSEDTYQYPFGFVFGSSNYTGSTPVRQNYIYSATGSATNATYYIPNKLKTVTITGGNILYGAFYGCSMLEEINLPDVTSIGANAFYGCKFIGINIPSTVTTIGSHAFYNCTNLASITLPNGLEAISNYMFSGCTQLVDIEIPASVKNIGEYAFQNCSTFKNVEVPSNVQSIGYYAFSGCSNIESMVLPFVGTSVKNSEEANQYPFGHIFGGSSYADSTGVRQNYIYSATGSATNATYYIPNKLKTVTITGGNILYGAFYGCSMLEEINLPDVTSIGANAFYGCKFIGINIPSTVTTIGSHAFYNCTNLASITLPNGLEAISNYMFSGCTQLVDIEIPASVKNIGEYAFQNCSTFKNVEVPSNVQSIGNYAFSGCSNIESMVLPFVGGAAREANEANQYAFGYIFGGSSYSGAYGVKQYYVYSTGGAITYTTYYLPGKLKAVTITGGRIVYGAFYSCTAIETINLPSDITTIESNAFYNCDALVNIVLPNTITEIKTSAFAESGITNIYFKGTQAEWELVALNGNLALANVYFYTEGELVNATDWTYVDGVITTLPKEESGNIVTE